MKIVIDCRMTGKSGIGTYLDEILTIMLQQSTNNKNYFLLLGDTNKLKKFNINNNTSILQCDIEPFSIKELLFFPKKIAKIINTYDAYYTPYCNIPSNIKIPIFSTIHDVVFLDILELTSYIGRIARKFFYKYACFFSKKIFTVSEFSKQRIKYHLKTKKEILVTYNGVSKKYTDNFESHTKEDIILFVGNIKKHKGIQYLIPAFLKAKSILPNIKLYIVGSKDNLRTANEQIQDLINSCNDNSIVFTEKISSEELVKLYRKSKLLVQPSIYEGFGIPPLEALYSNTNVVLSDIPVFLEIYKDFPVRFFESENIDDLTDKIITEYQTPLNISNFPKKYSYEESANIILNNITMTLDNKNK